MARWTCATHQRAACLTFPHTLPDMLAWTALATRNRLNIRHWPPASCGDGGQGTTSSEEEEEEDAFDQPRGSDAIGRGRKETAAPRAVVLAGNLSQLPRSMRLGGAVVFTDLSSPNAWR